MIKSCENCNKECKYNEYVCDEWEKEIKKYKLSFEQIKKIIRAILKVAGVDEGTSAEEIQRLMRDIPEILNEEFKPIQKYCCDVFRDAVKYDLITKVISDRDSAFWYWQSRRVKYCFNCGKEPIKPIQEKE